MSDWKKEYDKNLKEIPKETKQKILDLLWSGKSVGEICELVNLNTLYVSGVIVENIDSVSYLRKDVK